MGKYRHLGRVASADGHFVVLAIDHRANLRDELDRGAPRAIDDETFAAFKQEVITALAAEVTGVLTDPAYGIGQAVAARTVHGRLGLLAPLEITNYDLHPSQRELEFIPGWSVAQIKRMGGDGVKLLLPYHPDADSAADKQAAVEQIVADCARHDIPFFLEPVAFSLDPAFPLPDAELREVTVTMARQFSALGVDVLKLQFPANARQNSDRASWREACAAVDAACSVPWALLSGGSDYPTFADQARIACESGASGVIVGRAVWSDAVTLDGEARATFLRTTAAERMRELAAICAQHARPWFARVTAPDASLNWYENG
jgi:tagatose-1,6-bisphosphate aldolase